ncbi:hypothetical protein B296_00003851 [Ensete ventricosum]|uniref:Uncharacterized protein n=1 Tax=Ensete ventricosum TaxID=4639 RepID=A0A427B5C5_ENSVE|nr:hypothetical protein B296_00003851 [Ensete ventricosum]
MPFSLSTPYRLASSYAGSIIIAALTPCYCSHLLSIASVFSHSHTSALLPCKPLLVGHPYPATATSLNFSIFLPHCHFFPLSSRVATSIVVAALVLSPPHQHVALFLSSSAVIIPAIAASLHCCPTALALPSPATCQRYLAVAISLQSCPTTLSTILSNATTHGTPQPLFIAHRLSRCHLLPRSATAYGFGLALVKKMNLNSLASWLKDEVERGFNRLYHIRARPLRVVGKAQHINMLDVSYRAIWTRKAVTCSVGSELSSYASSVGRQKLGGISLS